MREKDDPVLQRIFAEVAKEMNLDIKVIASVYNHFITYIHRQMSAVRLAYMDKDFIRKNAVNINIVGFGKLLNKYGKEQRKRLRDTPVPPETIQ
jgi:hypothetical protein